MVKAVLFDIDNTLLSFDGYVREAMKNGFARFGLCEYEDHMLDAFHKTNAELWRSLEQGELSFDELIKIRWNMIFADLGISADGVEFEKYFREYLFDSAIVIDGAEELLAYLNGKYILCVASNGPYDQQVNRLKTSGLSKYFTHIFISGEIGHQKPSAKFFETCLARINAHRQSVSPEEMLIVGDSLTSDMTGGLGFGMQTCLYDPKHSMIPDEMHVNHVVSDLREIKNIL